MLARRTLLTASASIAAAPPLRAATSHGTLVIAKQIDGITSLDPQDPSLRRGELAEGWSVSGDG